MKWNNFTHLGKGNLEENPPGNTMEWHIWSPITRRFLRIATRLSKLPIYATRCFFSLKRDYLRASIKKTGKLIFQQQKILTRFENAHGARPSPLLPSAVADACSLQAQLSDGNVPLESRRNTIEKGLLDLEQWAGLGKWERSAGRKERGRC